MAAQYILATPLAKLQRMSNRLWRDYPGDGFRQLLLAERFWQFWQPFIGTGRKLGKSGCKDDGEIRLLAPDQSREIGSCHDRHGLVRDNKVDRGLRSDYFQRLLR